MEEHKVLLVHYAKGGDHRSLVTSIEAPWNWGTLANILDKHCIHVDQILGISDLTAAGFLLERA